MKKQSLTNIHRSHRSITRNLLANYAKDKDDLRRVRTASDEQQLALAQAKRDRRAQRNLATLAKSSIANIPAAALPETISAPAQITSDAVGLSEITGEQHPTGE